VEGLPHTFPAERGSTEMDYPFRSIFSDEFNDYLSLLSKAGKKTVRKYRGTFKSLDIYLADAGVREKALTESLISGWIHTITGKSRTKSAKISHVRSFVKYLTALEIPAYEPDYMRVSSDYVPYTFTDEEFDAIITAADNLSRIVKTETLLIFPVLLRILYGCGLRVGEAITLRWEDVDLTNGIIIIKKAKNNKQRIVPMSGSLAEILKQYRDREFKQPLNGKLLFESPRGHGESYQVSTFRDWFLLVLEQANISNHRSAPFERGITPHLLRHYFTFKSFLKAEAEGRSLEQTAPYLSAFLGHETLCETEKYITKDYTLYEKSHMRMNESIGNLFPEVDFDEQ
jgi:integrase